MDIQQRDRLNDSDVTTSSGTVLVMREISVEPGTWRRRHQIAAGAVIPDTRDKKGVAVTVMFHAGCGTWCLSREYMSIQKRTHFDHAPLRECLRKLERLTGVTLPPIRMVEGTLPPYNAITGAAI